MAEEPALDALTAAVKGLIARGRERGYVTCDEVDAALPPDRASPEMVEDTMVMLNEIGIHVVEAAGDDEAPSPARP